MVARVVKSALLLLTSLKAVSQEVSLQMINMNAVYVGFDNPLGWACDAFLRDELTATTSNGEIRKNYLGLSYIPFHPGRAVVYVSRMGNDEYGLIDSFVFRAKPFLPPLVTIGAQKSGEMSAGVFRVQIGPTARVDDLEHYLSIVGFDILFIHDSEIVAERHHQNEAGCRFADDAQTETLIDKLRAGDTVWLRNVVGRYAEQKILLNDVILHLK